MILNKNLAIGYSNTANGKTVSASTSASGYPAANLSIATLFDGVWRSTTGSLTNQNIDVDLGSSRDIDILALIGVNFTDNATIAPKTSEVSNFSSTEYNPGVLNAFNLTYTATLNDDPRFGRIAVVLPGTTYNSRYARLTVSDAGNPNNYLKSSVLWAGPLWQLEKGLDWDFEPLVSFVGVPGLEVAKKGWKFSIKWLEEAKYRQLISIILNRMRSGRYLVIPHPLEPAKFIYEIIYCTLTEIRYFPLPVVPVKWQIDIVFHGVED